VDESTLRSYFRKVLGVAPGASRKELRQCRDKRAQRWRTMLIQPIIDPNSTDPLVIGNKDAAKVAEHRLAITNTAYDCLSDFDKFRDFQQRLVNSETELPDLDSMLSVLGESAVKPPAPRVLEKRQAEQEEKMERIRGLVTEKVRTTGREKAVTLMQGRLPDADSFYDNVYRAARDAGFQLALDEMATLAESKLELDQNFKSDIDEVIVDQAEMVAHKEADRLEEKAAATAPTSKTPRMVAGALSVVIMAGVVSLCFWGATSQPSSMPTVQNGSKNLAVAPNLDAATAPVHVPEQTAGVNGVMPAAPAAGIANSVFNRSVFGADSAVPTPKADVAATQTGTSAQASTATADVTSATACEAISEYQIKATPVPDKIVAMGVALLNIGGTAGLAGYPNTPGKTTKSPSSKIYIDGVLAAQKQDWEKSLKSFRDYYAETKAPEALYNEATVLSLKNDDKAAVDVYNKLLEANKAQPQALYNRGIAHGHLADAAWQASNTQEWARQLLMALNNYTLAIKTEPRLAQAYYNRGIVRYRLGQSELAYQDFDHVQSMHPAFVDAAVWNRDVVGFFLKKNAAVPKPPVPPQPIGPVGPAGPPG
jgi:hypothetical protein